MASVQELSPRDLAALARRPEARTLDWMLIIIFLGFFSVIPFASQILYFGDWDFWVDWKDKLWWPIIAPMSMVLLIGAIQSLVWKYVRLPIGGTFTAMMCVLMAWMSRVGTFNALEAYPLNFVWPSTTIPLGLIMDLTLIGTRSLIFTSLFGGFLCGLFFYAVNWLMLMPYLQPVDVHGSTFTVADLMGYQFVRPQTPEYLRRVDQGTLQAFLGERIWITVFTAGVVCPIAYWVGVGIGWVFGTFPYGRKIKEI